MTDLVREIAEVDADLGDRVLPLPVEVGAEHEILVGGHAEPAVAAQLVLELQPNQLITMTGLDTNLTPKNKPFTSRLILLFLS